MSIEGDYRVTDNPRGIPWPGSISETLYFLIKAHWWTAVSEADLWNRCRCRQSDICRVDRFHMTGIFRRRSELRGQKDRDGILPPSTVCTPRPACTAQPLRRDKAETESRHSTISTTHTASLNCFCFVASLLTFIIYYPAGLDNIMKWHAWWNEICYPRGGHTAALILEHKAGTVKVSSWLCSLQWSRVTLLHCRIFEKKRAIVIFS